MPVCVIALLGAPGVRKSALAASLQAALADEPGSVVVIVPDLLAQADVAGRLPVPDTFLQLADSQTRQIEDAKTGANTVLTLSTALQIAAQSSLRHGGAIALEPAAAAHAPCTVTLLLTPSSGSAEPAAPPAARCDAQSLDTSLRAALDGAGLPYGVLAGSAEQQLAAACAAIARARSPAAETPRWHWFCERCGDGACERHVLRTT